MSEPSPPLSPEQAIRPGEPPAAPDTQASADAATPGQELVYRPLSGLAIASVVAGAAYTGMVLVALVVGFLKREPMFLADWLVLVPIAGFVLALLGQRHIHRSEGTRAGLGLARWGLWLSLLSGLGYFTFVFFTGMALAKQADDFAQEFFLMVKNGELNKAFLQTQGPSSRRTADPNDQVNMEKQYNVPFSLSKGTPKGALGFFREGDLVRALLHSGPAPATVEPMGVKSWRYEGKGYKVERNYRITNAEGVFDVLLTLQSVDSDVPGEGRKWQLVMSGLEPLDPVQLTPLGEKLRDLRIQSHLFLSQWAKQRPEGLGQNREEEATHKAFLETRPVAERETLRRRLQAGPVITEALSAVQAATPALLPTPAPLPQAYSQASISTLTYALGNEKVALNLPDIIPLRFPSGYRTFMLGGSPFESERLKAPDAETATQARKNFPFYFQGLVRDLQGKFINYPPFSLKKEDAERATWQITKEGNIQLTARFESSIENSIIVVGEVVTECPDVDPSGQKDLPWRLVRVELIQVHHMPPPGPN